MVEWEVLVDVAMDKKRWARKVQDKRVEAAKIVEDSLMAVDILLQRAVDIGAEEDNTPVVYREIDFLASHPPAKDICRTYRSTIYYILL